MPQNDNHGHSGHSDVSISGFNGDTFNQSPVSFDFGGDKGHGDHGHGGNVSISGFNGDTFNQSPVSFDF
jgi:hypothetical protein